MILALDFRIEAENELDQAFQWYQKRRDGLGLSFLRCVEESLERIRRSPESYPVVYRHVRQVLVRRFPFAIYFVTDVEAVAIIAVFHSSRDPSSWQLRV